MKYKLIPTWITLIIIFTSILPISGLAATPEQVTIWKKRYQEGAALEKQGKLDEALAVFTEILSQDPDARGSLFKSGVILIRKFQFQEALPFMLRFKKLEPQDVRGTIALIKIYQSLGDSEQVNLLRQSLVTERAGGKNPRLNQMLSYERELIPMKNNRTLSVQDNLDPSPTRFTWAYVLLDSKNVILRRLELTRVQAPNAVQYALAEVKSDQGRTSNYKILSLLDQLPDYLTARAKAVEILQATP